MPEHRDRPQLIIRGDEAWLPEEWEAHLQERRREAERRSDPERRERRRAYRRAYYAANRGRLRAYQREWQRRVRGTRVRVGWLHELVCDGNHTRADGRSWPRKRIGCTPIPCYDRPQLKVAA